MKTNKVNLGKVSVTIAKEPWDINKDYDRLTIVEVENAYCTYISRKPVPSGTDIENTEYWMMFSKYTKTYNSNEGVFNMSKYLKLKNEEDSLVKLNLTQAVTNAPLVIKNAGQIITFLDTENVWQQYQYQSDTIDDWDNLLKWKNLNDSSSTPIEEGAHIYNISEYLPGGAKYGQLIGAGVYTIYGDVTPVSQYRTIFGWDPDLGEVNNPAEKDTSLVIKEIDTDGLAAYEYYVFVGNDIDGFGYQAALNSNEVEVPEWISKAFGDVNSLINVVANKLDAKKVDKEEGKGLSANDFTDNNVSELADSINNVNYDSTNKKLIFTKNDNTTIEVDATDFIKDGMVSTVSIEDGNLVITFNTDSSKEAIIIPLIDIFNPANYYTKTDIDGKLVPATTNTLGLVKLYNTNGANKSGLLVQEDGSLLINTSSKDGLYRDDIGQLKANIKGAATDEEINAGTSTEKAITPSNLSKVKESFGLATIATSGSYNDLNDKPTIPTKTSDLNNDSKFVSENALTNKQDVLTVPYVANVNFSASVNAYYNLLNFNHLTNASIELPQNAKVNTDVIIFLLKIGTPELGETLNINFYCNGYSIIFPAGFYFEPGSDYEIEFRRTGTHEWTPVKIHNLTNDSTKTRIIIHTKEETTIASLTPNVLHKWGTIDSLTISAFDTPSEVTLSYKEFINEYMIEFTSGSTATTLSLPSSIVWAETPNIEANATYQISVINNLGIIVKFS